MTADEWHLHARCRGLETNLFFGERGGEQATYHQAMEVCNGAPVEREQANSDTSYLVVGPPCPVRDECLAFAMKSEDQSFRYGIFGGLSPNDRDTLGKYELPDRPRVEAELRAGRIVIGSRSDARRRRVARQKAEQGNEQEASDDPPRPEPDREPAVFVVPVGFSEGLANLFRLLRSARNEEDNLQRARKGFGPVVYRYEE